MQLLTELWKHRMLVVTMARRQYQLRYRQSFVGIAWTVIPTIATLAASTLVFHGVAQIDTGSTPYAIVTLAALVPWGFFASCLTMGIPSIVAAQPMVTRLAFPKATLPLSNVGISLIDLTVTTLIFGCWVIISGQGIPLTAVWSPNTPCDRNTAGDRHSTLVQCAERLCSRYQGPRPDGNPTVAARHASDVSVGRGAGESATVVQAQSNDWHRRVIPRRARL